MIGAGVERPEGTQRPSSRSAPQAGPSPPARQVGERRILYQHAGREAGWTAEDSFTFTASCAPAALGPPEFRVTISYDADEPGRPSRLLANTGEAAQPRSAPSLIIKVGAVWGEILLVLTVSALSSAFDIKLTRL